MIFVFHANTNAAKQQGLSAGGSAPASAGAGVDAGHQLGVNAKVQPPRLGGRRVGLFATRTPHRPNPIGLSLVRIESVDRERGVLTLSGLDLVDGTPVLDIKPYLPYADTASGVRIPEYVRGEAPFRGHVVLAAEAESAIARLAPEQPLLRDAATLRSAIEEVLQNDIRALHHRVAGRDSEPFRFVVDRVSSGAVTAHPTVLTLPLLFSAHAQVEVEFVVRSEENTVRVTSVRSVDPARTARGGTNRD